MSQVTIVDYGVGNVRSIINALEKVGATSVVVSNDKETILNSDGVVLPGVGAFSHGMAKLKENGLDAVIKDYAGMNKPLLGICLGMQMLFSESEEFGLTLGLDLIEGKIQKLKTLNPGYEKLPHVSWNEIAQPDAQAWDNTILDGLNDKANMYFVHTFAASPLHEEHILSTTEYSDYVFCSTVKKGNIYGCQFHPEKSAVEGLSIMKNFVKICEESKNGK
ncbi:imidazole glycerol phosphate synthase subunit HisH [Pseudoalteromonas sp. OOF1S-7]|uniref:imidazole glycerol phosphate synthase subunit HisH n=1 Tax=Pseudoalteromonas sp. OOF1S-7 TaxID=2917757 RepID=UPI001EF5D177|nr:imidazole glycerol phosphate synthase subunit HisH [Pseudoalteromonas sp. OOF1S-7]MCG7536349.1 imidazole glycerol phosphate synthase subunit HisH [Pseudoalteromonas sp. OOF1S-7]